MEYTVKTKHKAPVYKQGLSISEILKTEGIYQPIGDGYDGILIVVVCGTAIYVEDGCIEKIEKDSWKNTRFRQAEGTSVTLTFEEE